MSYVSQLSSDIKNSERSLNFNEKLVEKSGRVDSTPFIKVNVEKGKIMLSTPVIECLELDKNRFNYAIDSDTNEIFFHVSNEKGWKPTKGTKSFSSYYLAKTLQSHFEIEDDEFTITFNVIPENCEDTLIWKLSYETTLVTKEDNSMYQEVEVEEIPEEVIDLENDVRSE